MRFITSFAMAAFVALAVASPTLSKSTGLVLRGLSPCYSSNGGLVIGSCDTNGCEGDKSSDGLTCTAVCKILAKDELRLTVF